MAVGAELAVPGGAGAELFEALTEPLNLVAHGWPPGRGWDSDPRGSVSN